MQRTGSGIRLYIPEEWELTYEFPYPDRWVYELWSEGCVELRFSLDRHGAYAVGRYRVGMAARYEFDADETDRFKLVVWTLLCMYATAPLV